MNRRQRRRRALVKRMAVGAPLAALGLLWLAGLFLPVQSAVEVTASLPAPPETVWGVLTDLDGMPSWRQDLSRLKRLPDRAGHVRWLEVRAGKETALERIEALPPVRLVIGPAGSTADRRWVYQLKQVGRGTEIAVREERWIANPLVRSLVGITGGSRHRIESFARDLERRLSGRREQIANTAGASVDRLTESSRP